MARLIAFLFVSLTAVLLYTPVFAQVGTAVVPVGTSAYTVPVTIGDVTSVITVTLKNDRVIGVNAEFNQLSFGKPARVVKVASSDPYTPTLSIQVDVPEFPAGEPDEASVIFVGNFETSSSGNTSADVIIRNNTNEVIYEPGIEAEAYDADGNLLGFGDNVFVFFPRVVEPGQITVGQIYFKGMEVTEADTVEIVVYYEGEDEDFREYALSIDSFGYSHRSSESFIGQVSNPNDIDIRVSGHRIALLCFEGEYGETYTDHGDTNADVLAPGESAPFQLVSDCTSYIVSATGYRN